MDKAVERILSLMKEKGYDQKTFAEQLGIRAQIITDWKKGTTTSYTRYIQRIAELLGVSADYLLTGTVADSATVGDPDLAAALAQFEKLTPEQRAKVIGYMEGLISSR